VIHAVLVVAVGVGTALGVLLLPVPANRWLRDARAPTDAEAEQLATLRDPADLHVRHSHVLESPDESAVTVAVRGPPGWRELYVSGAVLATLDEEVATALVAAEAGRAAAYYGEVRAVGVGVVFGLLAAIVAGVVPGDVGLPAMGVFALALFALARHRQYRADQYAAQRVGADRVAAAFEAVAERRGVEPETGDWRTYFEVQPELGDRIRRLREQPDRP